VKQTVAALSLAALAMASAPATAIDNTSWTFDVLDVVIELDDNVLVRLKPVPPGRNFPRSCEELIIHSTFAPRKIHTPSGETISQDSHLEAIRTLLQAKNAKNLLRVGSIDTGFGAIPGKPKCEVASRAFSRLMEEDNVWAVYSFY